MNNFFKRSIILIYFITLVGCGYTPMMTNNSYNFKVEIESLRGDEDINNYIKNNIERLDGNKTYFLILSSSKDKIIVSKDSKGDPSILEIIVTVKYKIKFDDSIILEREIIKNNTYNNINDKFELAKFEKNIIKNLSNSISNGITSSIFLSTK